ncbi:MAG: type IV pilin protein [Gammaproteobacteria bacterium]
MDHTPWRDIGSRQWGFTLIEVLITVAIVGILASVALPSYRNQVMRSNRSVVQGYMLNVMNRQEQFRLDARQYFTGCAPVSGGCAAPNNLLTLVPPPAEVTANYSVTVAANNAATPPTFLVTATAIGGQMGDGNLTIDHAGTKMPAAKWK